MSSRPTVKAAAVAALAIVTLALASCTSGGPTAPSEQASGSASPGLPVETGQPEVYGQKVTWEPCGEFECATIDVPIDWTNPDGQTTGLALNRKVAAKPDQRIGSLLINPGGPGGSGIDLLEYFVTTAGESLLDSYDVIGFDPRGVAESSPAQCGDAAIIDGYYLQDVMLETQEQIDASRQATEEFAAVCEVLTGPLIENMDTSSAARDMDLIRALVGDESLNYLGFSYGTQLGATYAALYPERVGHMVLDGAVDFLLPAEQVAIEQAEGFERSLTNFISWCLTESPSCALDKDPERAREQIRDIALTARDQGYPNAAGDEVNGTELIYGIVVTLYDEASWEYLDAAIQEVVAQDTAETFFQLANFYLDRDSTTGEYLSNSMWAFTAVGCLDSPSSEPTTVESLTDFTAKVEAVSPTFGWWFAASTGCDGWPWTAKEPVTSLDAAADAAPILVVGTTNDPATPYSWAQSLTARLGEATLLTYDGEGHTAYGRSNACITDAVDGYLVDGVMPAEGTTC